MQDPDLVAATLLGATAALYSAIQVRFVHAIAARPPRARHGRGARSRLARTPKVSILKPLAGLDDGLADNLASFAALDYPDYELLLGLAAPDDPAAPIARALLARHPELDARIVWTDPDAALNPKVAQLVDLASAARGEVLVVSDSNVRVRRSYLRSMLEPLLRPGVGLVTSLIAGSGARTLGAALDAAQLAAFVAPAVVAADTLGGRAITIGKSMAMRREAVERVGGFAAVGHVLAEDDALGQRMSANGYGVVLCLDPVHCANVRGSVTRTVQRHARWAKMRRWIAPACFALEPLLSPLLVAMAWLVAMPSALAAKACVLAWALQSAGAMASSRALSGGWPRWYVVALEPLRTAMSFVAWSAACLSRRVEWRGNAFLLTRGSELVPIGGAEGAVAERPPASGGGAAAGLTS